MVRLWKRTITATALTPGHRSENARKLPTSNAVLDRSSSGLRTQSRVFDNDPDKSYFNDLAATVTEEFRRLYH